MKKATIFMATLATLMCATSLATPKTTHAAETVQNNDLTKYYDLNNDDEFSISDAVLANQLLDDGRFSKQDFLNVCNLIVGNEINMSFEEFDINEMEVNEDSIFKIQSTVSSYCVGYDYDGITVTYRYLNDGVVSEMHCSLLDIVETVIAIPTYNDVPEFIGISPNNELVIDANRFWSFKHHEIKPYEVWDLDDMNYHYANSLLYVSGKFENFLVTPEYGYVQLWFNNGVTVTEINVNRIAPIEKVLRSFEYEGETLTIGVTADGKVAVDTYSFDIAE